MKSILEQIKNGKILVSDGAWGTLLFSRGLQVGDCPEEWNLTHRDDVYAIAKSYIDAGSDIVLTNSFGGSPFKLDHYGFKERTAEINIAAATISREAAGEEHFVMGSIGPTGVMLMMGDVSEEELFEGFKLQADALKKGGVDAICVETMSDIDEASVAVKAAKSTGLEVICTFTFERTVNGDYKTMMGISPAQMVEALKEAGADIIGANCGNGIDQMVEVIREIRKADMNIPVLVHANAGIPVIENGKTVFPESPEVMAAKVYDLLNSGVNIIGGCCGTTPEHISEMVKIIRRGKC